MAVKGTISCLIAFPAPIGECRSFLVTSCFAPKDSAFYRSVALLTF